MARGPVIIGRREEKTRNRKRAMGEPRQPSRCGLLIGFLPEGVAGEVHEDVFEGGLADGDGLGAAGEGGGELGDQRGAALVLETDAVADDRRLAGGPGTKT